MMHVLTDALTTRLHFPTVPKGSDALQSFLSKVAFETN